MKNIKIVVHNCMLHRSKVQRTEIFDKFIVCWNLKIKIDDDVHTNSYTMKNLIISVIYFFIGLICIILLNQSAFWTGFIAKALIIPLLMILFLMNINPRENRLHRLMFAGLFFSWAGDVVLEFH